MPALSRGMHAGVFLEGDKELAKLLRKWKRDFPAATATAMFEEAADIFTESQSQVPVDTGRLKESGLVNLDRTGGISGVKIHISYDTHYAVAVHERRELDAGRTSRAEVALSNPGYTPKGSQGGKSKYLQDPFENGMRGIQGRLATRIQILVAGGGHIIRTNKQIRGSRT